ncbi:MAG: bifunctional phosphoribosylaminoimidazolecarboxamide formyltransferase/IMP cyclohydrolase [Endomicrobiia bacterium]|nr:bifunctional phosphoribosylaminoimidazolecarboxamide formyltransferase/IMP cyclohydrolase [Endomicrobiia bacterium]
MTQSMKGKKKKIAVVSVSDKTGLADFVRGLAKAGYDIVATSGTAAFLSKMGMAVRDVSCLTGFSEMLSGRVKTLHPAVFAGVLAAGHEHLAEIKKYGIAPIDIVVVNFYPFESKSRGIAASASVAADHIDVGGVAMLRAAAKNYARVLAVSSGEDYAPVLDALSRRGGNTLDFRRRLAAKAFSASAYYDALISCRLSPDENAALASMTKTVPLKFAGSLRYGENPHQSATFYSCPSLGESFWPERLGGEEVSYNNLLDVFAGFSLVGDLLDLNGERGKASCVVIKHTNPCGAASARTAVEAYRSAFSTDPVSAFGGAVVFGTALDAAASSEIIKVFTDVVAAPDFSGEALEILRKKKNLLILKTPRRSPAPRFEIRSAFGGVLAQTSDHGSADGFKVVTKKRPSVEEMKSLAFAASVAKHSKSNAVALAAGLRTLGVGSGCVSRIDAFHAALGKMRARSVAAVGEKIVLASDAFLPFDDIAREAASAGVSAIIQPGGSIRDADSVKACDDAAIAMVFTGVRHFKH